MRLIVLLLSASLWVASTGLSGQEPTARAQQPAFRAGVDLVSLSVTVTNGSGHYVGDLEATDFTILEDGIAQAVTFFNRREQPLALSLLLDSSASMDQHLDTLQTAATTFVQRIKPTDIAQVVDFDSRVQVRQQFTGNHQDLAAAIGQLEVGGSTSLHNAVYIALRELAKVRAVDEQDIRRSALVLFSDGQDTSSLVSFEEVLDLAKRSDTAIFSLALRGADVDGKGYREAEYVLRSLASETGGRAYFPTRVEQLTDIYSEIADELASRYTLGYASTNVRRDGKWRRLTVQVGRAGVAARTKRGYYAPGR